MAEGKRRTLEYAEYFTDLKVYRKAEDVAHAIFELSKGFPREEVYSLTDQVRRSSSSIGAQIAEAWGKRPYVKYFASKLTDADAERLETEHWVRTARKRDYLSPEEEEALVASIREIGKMLNAMRSRSEAFCHGSQLIRDGDLEYDAS